MKKVILAVAVVALGFATTSCGKKYTCVCSSGTTTVTASNTTDAALKCYDKGCALQ